MASFDILGNIALVKFPEKTTAKEKKRFALEILERQKSVSTVVEKAERFKGRLRTIKTRHLAGDKTKEVLYKENGCEFRFNIETCYFSSRLSSERLEIAKQCKKGENVLVMFGGVAPFAIVIAKHGKAERIVSVELGRECNKYAIENVKRNRIKNVEIVQGDVKKKINGKEKFERIVMARPNLKESFLPWAFKASKKGTIIYYYGFYNEDDKDEMIELIDSEARKAKKKVKILRMKRAGDIAPYKYRYRCDFKVLN